MAIKEYASLSYWNYFLALESDLVHLSRFVEFTTDNFKTHSIEMVHLLLTAASEVDVVIKQLCKRVSPTEPANDMKDCRKILQQEYPDLAKMKVCLPRYGLELTPWLNWQQDKSPDWWSDHNKVKHRRGEHFNKANLKNVLNAIGGLFLVLVLFYRGQTERHRLVPAPSLFDGPGELMQRSHYIDGQTGLCIEPTESLMRDR